VETFLSMAHHIMYSFCVPYIGTYGVALMLWPPLENTWMMQESDSLDMEQERASLEHSGARRIHMRIVTRGMNPKLVADCCRKHHALFQSLQMPSSEFVLEVVTDNVIRCAEMSGIPVEEIVVPSSYQSTNGTKWKARALQYALETVSASADDWIVHLDEETMMDEHTIAAIWEHAEAQTAAVARGERKYPDMGQGAILYGAGKHGPIENWATTLADSIRVTDDFGSFRLAFSFRERMTFGMKGSFVVMSQSVANLISWDLGPELSLTEDAAFNMIALGRHKVCTTWIDAVMYEQSPFTLKDFVRQRERWFAGLVLCLRSSETRSWCITPMVFKVILWSLSPLFVASFFMDIFAQVNPVHPESWIFIYMLGFLITYSPKDGLLRWLRILSMQLLGIPFFAALEAVGAICGVAKVLKGKAGSEFHIVQNEVDPRADSDKSTPLLLGA